MSYHVAEFTDILQEPAASIFRVPRVSHYKKWDQGIRMGGKDMVLWVNLWEMVEPRGGRDKHMIGYSQVQFSSELFQDGGT
jgi:hypothetical protein